MVFIRFSLFISIFNLIAITIDRYLSIFHPVKQRNQSRYFVRLVICAVWSFSFVAVALIYCITRWGVSKKSTQSINLIFPISSYPATVVFVYCYTAIYMWIRQRNRKDIKNEVSFKIIYLIPKKVSQFLLMLQWNQLFFLIKISTKKCLIKSSAIWGWLHRKLNSRFFKHFVTAI